MTTAAQRTQSPSSLGRWIADQRDQGAAWSDITIELNITEPEARELEKRFLDEIAAREREFQHALW